MTPFSFPRTRAIIGRRRSSEAADKGKLEGDPHDYDPHDPKQLRWNKGKPRQFPEDWQRLLDAWRNWADLSIPGVSTRDLYEVKLRIFCRFLAEQHPKALDYQGNFLSLNAGHIRSYLVWLDNVRKLSGATRFTHRSAVRSLCKYLAEDGFLAADPFVATRIPRPQVVEPVVRPVAPVDLEALLKAAACDHILGERDVTIIKLLASTGLRVSEMCALTLSDLNTREGLLLVRHGKGDVQRIVSVEPLAMRQVNRYLQWRRRRMTRRDRWADPCDSLFITRNGGPLTDEQVRQRLKDIAARAGIDPRSVHPHVFRHTSATMAADAGMAIPEMNALFGWARDSGMAERYTATTTALRAIASHRAIRPLERALGRR